MRDLLVQTKVQLYHTSRSFSIYDLDIKITQKKRLIKSQMRHLVKTQIKKTPTKKTQTRKAKTRKTRTKNRLRAMKPRSLCKWYLFQRGLRQFHFGVIEIFRLCAHERRFRAFSKSFLFSLSF